MGERTEKVVKLPVAFKKPQKERIPTRVSKMEFRMPDGQISSIDVLRDGRSAIVKIVRPPHSVTLRMTPTQLKFVAESLLKIAPSKTVKDHPHD